MQSTSLCARTRLGLGLGLARHGLGSSRFSGLGLGLEQSSARVEKFTQAQGLQSTLNCFKTLDFHILKLNNYSFYWLILSSINHRFKRTLSSYLQMSIKYAILRQISIFFHNLASNFSRISKWNYKYVSLYEKNV